MMIDQFTELDYENRLLYGKNMDFLPYIPDDTFDMMVTDPPYGLSNAKNRKDILKEAIGVFANLIFPDFNEGDIKIFQYSDLVRILVQSSELRRLESGAVRIESWIGVPERSVDLDYDVKIREVEITTADETPCIGVTDSVLVNEVDSIEAEFIGNFILDFGDSADFTSSDALGCDFGQLSAGFFAMPITSIGLPSFDSFEGIDPPFLFGEDFTKDIRLINDAGSDTKPSRFVLTSWRAKRGFMLRFADSGKSTAEFSSADGANQIDGGFEKSGPALVRTFAGTGCLSSMFKSTRVSFVFSIADRTYSFYFHLWLPPKFLSIISRLGKVCKGFMGEEWDGRVPSVSVWKECLRVMKPGAFGFIMCATRQDCLMQMMTNLHEAGFQTNFTSLYWVYATGLIKAADISKSADRRMGAQRPRTKPAIPRTDLHGDRPWMQEAENGQYCFMDDQPITDEAKALHGAFAGYSPRPALECILVVMKPLAHKTYIDQALDNGKGITWLGNCRIPASADDIAGWNKGDYKGGPFDFANNGSSPKNSEGRCAANLIVSDDALNDGKERKSGGSGQYHDSGSTEWFGNKGGYDVSDSGSFSRYFDLDRWAIEQLPQGVQDTFPCMIVAKPSKREKDTGVTLPKQQMYKEDGSANSLELIGTTMGGRKERRNFHPTVKPVKLFGYLTILGSRRGDLVLDPYMGSGTSTIAARALGRRYTGIEMDEYFHQIAEQRCSAYWKYGRFL